MPSYHLLVILVLLLVIVYSTTSFILQDLPLERFERSGHHGGGSDELFGTPQFSQRQIRANQLYRPGANFWARYRMMSG